MRDHIEPESRATEADLAAISAHCTELGIFLQRLGAAVARSQVGELAHDVSNGESIAREKQLPYLMTHVHTEAGRLLGLAYRYSGRLLAAVERDLAADLATRRRQATRGLARYGPVDSLTGHVTVLPTEEQP